MWSALNHNGAKTDLYYCIVISWRNIYVTLYPPTPLPHIMGGLHEWIHLRLLKLPPTMLPSAEPSPELVRESGRNVWEAGSPLSTPPTTPFDGLRQQLVTAWVAQPWGKNVIIGATGAMCPALRAGTWRCGSGRAGERSLQLPPAYVALPDRRRPPSGSWRWARQPGNLPLLRWWLPAFVALPEGTNEGFVSHLHSQLPLFFSIKTKLIHHLHGPMDDKDDLRPTINTFSTTKRALSASCWATCFISTASVNSLPKVKCVWKNTTLLIKNPTDTESTQLRNLPAALYQWNVI